MKFANQVDVEGQPAAVWDALADVELVASCVPGAELDPSEDHDDNEYRGWLTVRFGPKTIKFGGDLTYTRDEATRTAVIAARGQDPRSRTRVKANVDLSVVESGAISGSSIVVSSVMDISGPLAPLVEAGGTQVGNQIIEEFAANLRERLSGTETAQTPSQVNAPAKSVNAGVFKIIGAIIMATLRRIFGRRSSGT